MKYPYETRGRTRTKWVAAVTAPILAVGSLIGVMVAPAANAAGATVAAGVVFADANGNGIVEASGLAGTIDKPLRNVPVRLVSAANSAQVIASTATAADGSYSFGDLDLAGFTDAVKILVNVQAYAGQIYAPEAASSANQLARESVTTASSVSFMPSTTSPQKVDGLLAPAWRLDASLFSDPAGMNGFGVYTGSGPFDSADGPGQDSSKGNNSVRSGDTINYNWIISASSVDSAGASAGAAVFEQTINLSNGAVANFAEYPAACIGNGFPANSIVAQPSGKSLQIMETPPAGTTSVTLTCNLGKVSNDEKEKTRFPSSTVWVSGESPRGGEIKTTGRAYGVDPQGAATIRPSSPVDQGPVIVTAAPRYDISKTKIADTVFTNQTIDGLQVPGYFIEYQVAIATDKRVGVEAFKQPVTVLDSLYAQYNGAAGTQNGAQNSVVPNLKWRITSCLPMTDGGADNSKMVLGQKASAGANSNKSVANSGSCAISSRSDGDSTSPQTLTFSNIDTSGQHYPTNFVGGSPIPADTYYVASYRIKAFIPLSEIDKTTGSPTDNVGALAITNVLSNFAPVGMSDAPNYGTDGREPGYCISGVPNPANGSLNDVCETINGGRSNNIAGPVNLNMSPGNWGKSTLLNVVPWANQGGLKTGASQSNAHSGDAQIQPGDYYGSNVSMTNTGSSPWTGVGLCDIFDSTVVKLSPLKNNILFNSPNAVGEIITYAIETGTPATSGKDQSDPAVIDYQKANQNNFVIKYAHVSTDGDDPLLGGALASDGTNRGTWAAQSAAKCGALDWKDSIGQVSASIGGNTVTGLDAANAIKIEAKPGSNYSLPSGGSLSMWLALQQRDTFNGGPHNGQSIPAGTLAVNYAAMTTDTFNKGWSSGRSYSPQPAGAPTDGDRWIVARAAMAITKETVNVDGIGKGVAGVGQRGTANAGDAVVWKVSPSLTAAGANPAPVNNVTVTDTLPAYVKYNPVCTSSLAGASLPTAVTENANGTTTLVWNLGTRTPNEAIKPLLVCTDLDPLTPGNYSAVNSVNLKADSVLPLAAHTKTHTVLVQQNSTLGLKKSVDKTQDLLNKSQNYTLTVKNFSQDLTIQSPTVLETLPYNNDGAGAAINRSPASSFTGTSGLAGPIRAYDYGGTTPVVGSVFYTTVPGAQVPQDLNKDTDPAIWVAESETVGWTAADWAKVSGFKFVSLSNLSPTPTSGSDAATGLVIKFQTKQHGNESGNLYANRFTAFSPSIKNVDGSYILLDSNQTTVRVVGFSLGDLIWIDSNRDGKYTEGTDSLAPAGVKVQIFKNGLSAPVVEVTTGAGGRWHADNLEEGDYYVLVPASEFAAGGPLAGRTALTVNSADSSVDANEDVDHNAVQDGAGIRSKGLVHFDASMVAGMLTGNGPLDDNVAKLPLPAATTDDFSNLTIDLALAPIPGYEFDKKANPVSGTLVNPGQKITYTLTGKNSGEETLNPVNISDDLSQVLNSAAMVPGSLKAVITGPSAPATTPAATLTGTDLAWKGTLAPGQTVTVTYEVTVDAKANENAVTIKNSAKSDATPPGTPVIDVPPVVTEHPVPGYAFSKVADPVTTTIVHPGDKISYTLVGKNTGATVLDPVNIKDNLAGVLNNAVFTAGSLKAVITGTGAPATTPAATLTGNDLAWTGTLAVGQTVTITYEVTVNGNADEKAAVLKNLAHSEATPPGLPPITPPDVSTEHPVPGYAFTKDADPKSTTAVLAGGNVTYTLVGKNTGATVLDPVTVDDDLTKVMDHSKLVDGSLKVVISGDKAPATAPEAVLGEDNKLTWAGVLAPGQSVTITYSVKVNSDADEKHVTLTNTAKSSATPPGEEPITPPEVTTVHPVPGYTFTKVADPESKTLVMPGNTVAYTPTGTNTGATLLNPVNISDDLSSVLDNSQLVDGSLKTVITGSGAPDAATQATLVDNKLAWTGTLVVGQSVTITYTVEVNEDANLNNVTLKNSAKSDATPPGLPPIPVDEIVTEHPVPGYTFTKDADPKSESIVQPGAVINYTLTGKNTGATVLEPVKIDDDLSGVLAHAKLVEGSLKATITEVDKDPVTASAPVITGTTLNWQGTLAVGQSVKVTYSVKLNADAEGVIVRNTATSTAKPPVLPELPTEPVETWHPTPGFTFMKTADPVSGSVVQAGGKINYTVTGNNFGETALETVVINDDLSGVLKYADIDAASLKAVVDGKVVAKPVLTGTKLSWNGSLERGQNVVLTYSVTVKSKVASGVSVIKNLASATATPPGGEPIVPPEVTTEHPITDFALAKTSDPVSGSTVKSGKKINYSVVGTNLGAAAIPVVDISDDLSKVLPYATIDPKSIKASINGKAVDAPKLNGTKLSWMGSLAVGEVVTLNYTVTVKSTDVAVTLLNVATAAWQPPGGPVDPTPPVSTTHKVPPVPVTPPTKGPKLSETGFSGAAIALVGAGMVGLGIWLVVRRRRENRA